MRSAFGLMLGLGLACGPNVPAGTDSEGASTASTTTGTTTETTTPTGSTTTGSGGPEVADLGDGLSEHGPCPRGDECEHCVQTPDGSVCGPQCLEYGPGFAPGRCPPSAVQGQSICPLDDDTPGVCLLMCDVDADCPDPGMRCVACPEPFASACTNLWAFSELGPRMCVWP